jgi:hypothetical protein
MAKTGIEGAIKKENLLKLWRQALPTNKWKPNVEEFE